MHTRSCPRSFRALGAATVCWLLLFGSGLVAHARSDRGRKYVPPPPTANIKVTVLDSSGKPVSNAAVIFHPIKNNKDDGAMELKSNPNGVVQLDVIPIGDVMRLQVIASGWRTFGEDYKIDSANKEFVVKLKRPADQASTMQGGGSAPPIDETAPKGQSTSAKPSDQTPIPK